MRKVKSGDTVRVHYTGTLLDGTEFDSPLERDPLEFTVGSGHVISGLDVALPGMVTGDKKTEIGRASWREGGFRSGSDWGGAGA